MARAAIGKATAAVVAAATAGAMLAGCGSDGDTQTPTTETVVEEVTVEQEPETETSAPAEVPSAAPEEGAQQQTPAEPGGGAEDPAQGAPAPEDPGAHEPAGFTAAEQAYLGQREQRELNAAPSDQAALDDGYAVCAAIEDGSDYLTVRQKAGHAGSEVEIGGVVNAAAENLCPEQRDRLSQIIRERD